MKIPRDLSGRELVQILTKNLDYKIIHQRGSHMVLETGEPSQHRITIPDHKALRIGTLLLFPRNFAKQKKPCRQETAFLFTSTDKVMESGWADLNRRPHAPQSWHRNFLKFSCPFVNTWHDKYPKAAVPGWQC